ncbi:GRIP and coiled-coil domain-containing protein 2 [Frankliniella occidentalis]|uniref:GRIP and coiled-coil domain-containing protein 2 n=1 Tax=Frankliniella occidentalis TaxID=133901 RepID=A0A6J1SC17_FRAOC|nr:GRIP and coiled-coil domain-containing protein 2 [Frankliniella occidentalis]
MSTKDTDDSQTSHKTPLERLSQEELIKKYRQAILIAQKAKESKSEFLKHIAQQEDLVRSLEEKLQKCESDKKAEAEFRFKLEADLKSARESKESSVQEKHDKDSGNSIHVDISENEQLKSKMEDLSSENSQLAFELETSKVKIVTQETELLKIKEELGEVSYLKSQLEKMVETKDSETKILQDTLNTEKETFEKCHQELCSKLKYLEESLKNEQEQRNRDLQMKQDILNLEDVLHKKEEDIKAQEQCINEQKVHLCRLEMELAEKQSLYTESCEKIIGLSSQLENLKDVIESKPAENEVEILTAEKLRLENELAERDKKNHVKEETLAQLSSALEEIKHKFQELEIASSEYSTAVIQLQSENELLSQKVSSLESEKRAINCRLEECKTIIEDKPLADSLAAENSKLQHEITIKDEEIGLKENSVIQMRTELQQIKEDFAQMLSESSSKIDCLESENMSLCQKISSLENGNEELNHSLMEKLNEIKEKEEFVSTLQDQLKDAQTIVREKQEHIEKLMSSVTDLESEVQNFKISSQSQQPVQSTEISTEEKTKFESEIVVRDEQISKMSAETCQILSELSKVKEDFLSMETQKLETLQKLADTHDLLEIKQNEIVGLNEKLAVAYQCEEEFKEKLRLVQTSLSEKESFIQELEQEISKLRDAAAIDSTNTEISSTFSLSRAEEMTRMKDLEDSFEDKYTKLRVVAVKLKKRVTDITQTLENERLKSATEKSELQSKLAQLASHGKTVQTLQAEVDRLQDLLEDQKRIQQQLSKDLESAVKEAASKKFELASVQEELSQVINEKKSLKTSLASLESSLSQTGTLKSEIEKLSKEIKEKDLTLDILKDEKQKLSEQLEKVCVDAKKKSVLSLEMADMEKSVSELNRQLSAERDRLKKSENDLEEEHSLLVELQNQCKKLEANLHVKEESNLELREQLTEANGVVEKLNLICKENQETIDQLSRQLESERTNIEKLNIQYSDLAAKQVQTNESARHQIEALSRQVFQLEEQCSSLQDNHKAVEDELATVRREFENYKVRAQSVLRQSAKQEDRVLSSSTVHDAEELEVEVERLRVNISSLKENLKQTMSQLQAAQQEVNVEREDKIRATTQAQSFKESCAQAVERQNAAEERLSVAVEEAKQAKLHSDMLVQCYKQQLEDLKTTHQKKIASLTEQIENLQMSIKTYSTAPAESDRAPSVQSAHSPIAEWTAQLPSTVHSDSDLAMRLSSLHREEGEGSESVDSFPSRRISVTTQDRRHELVPLDKLLSSTSYPEDDSRELARSNSSDLNVDLVQSKLSACESRAVHLTALLSEAESDAARLSQLNAVLKEEIRRQQRSEERAQHAHNLEYLKNIVVKFITLQNGDERQRLVPVLNTILKLSPEEASLVDNAAKGASQANSTGRGWGSYLPLPGWTGS